MKFGTQILTGLAVLILSVLAFGIHRTWPVTQNRTLSSGNEQMTIANAYISVSTLYDNCRGPGECGKPMACEGQTVLVSGKVDYNNVFEHSRYPQLPYEKFLLKDAEGKTVEVWAVSSDNEAIFRKIFDAQKQGNQDVIVKGTIRGFNMPTMRACHRGIWLELRDAEDISLK